MVTQGLYSTMKILHLCDSLNPAGLGGYESYLYYLSEQLSKRGHESVVVTQSPSHSSPNTIEFEHYRVYHLPGNFLEARRWEFLALPEDEREGVVEHMFQSDDLEVNVKALQEQLKNLINDLKPDLIHAHSVYVVFNRVLQSLREDEVLDNIPSVVTIHGRPKPLILPGGEKTTDYDAFVDSCPFSLILAVSNNVAEVLRDYLSRKGLDIPVQTLYLGINLSVFSPQPEVTKQWDVAFLGRLETMKAVDLFPEMLSSLKPDFPNLKFLMTGEGSYKDKLLRGFDNEGVTDMVDYLGVVETELVPNLINQSRIFIYPSREEPFGLSILEAMACEIPVVTTNVFGPSEIITQNKDGLAVPPGDVTGLVKAVRSLLQNPMLRAEIGSNGRLTVKTKFDIRIHDKKLLEVYQELIKTHKAGRKDS